MSAPTAGVRFGKYRIIRLLGQGGMADVYEAEETSVGRVVALKILPAAFARDQERAGRFAKEIQASAALDHPNIVSVFDVGEIDGLHYYTMSVLPGGDLKARLKTGALSQKEALRITREIADALHYAHEKGFVHRDVKPENILFREDGSAVLTDFGIARATGSQTRMTATGLSIGTPHYMSPEQARGKKVDGRSDLYALGVVFHEMLTGKVPFDAQDSFAVGMMHINDAPPELPKHLAHCQPVVDKLLAKESEDRYSSGEKDVADLHRREKGSVSEYARDTRVIKSSSAANLETDAHTTARAGGWRWAIGGGLVALLIVVGIYFSKDAFSPRSPGAGGSLPTPHQGIESADQKVRNTRSVADSTPTSDFFASQFSDPNLRRLREDYIATLRELILRNKYALKRSEGCDVELRMRNSSRVESVHWLESACTLSNSDKEELSETIESMQFPHNGYELVIGPVMRVSF